MVHAKVHAPGDIRVFPGRFTLGIRPEKHASI